MASVKAAWLAWGPPLLLTLGVGFPACVAHRTSSVRPTRALTQILTPNPQASCYFATKSLDEYLYLQQLALMEITRVVTECGCKLAFPTTHLDVSTPTSLSLTNPSLPLPSDCSLFPDRRRLSLILLASLSSWCRGTSARRW